MDSLPASALKVIGKYLEPQDAFSCRLTARRLAPVTAAQLCTSQIRVVANSFQLQLQQEDQASSRAAAAVTARAAARVDPPTQRLARLLIVSGDPHRQKAPTAAAIAAEGSYDTSGPTLRSRTAASLARAAAAGYSKAIVFIDVQEKYTKQTWQELFGALLCSSSSIAALTIVEYSSNHLRHSARKMMKLRRMRSDMADTTDGPWGPAAAAAAAAAGAAKANTAGSSSWLLALVSTYSTAGSSAALVHLELQLPAPIEPYVQPLLLQLTGLETLALNPTTVWPQTPPALNRSGPCEPKLRPCVIQGITQLSNLQSLTCCVATPSGREDSKLAAMLQQTFSNLGGQLTHLSFGTSSRSTQTKLSAPLISMYDLRSLICQRGLTLDIDDAFELLTDQSAAAGSSSNSPRFQIAPSLNKLVLNEGKDNSRVLGTLLGKGIWGFAAAAAAALRSQLVHLELNSQNSQSELPVEGLSQLAGLRHLNTVVNKPDLKVLSKSPLTSQLQGLTLLCKNPGHGHHAWAFMFCPLQVVTAFSSLHSLAVNGTQHSIHMDVCLDLHSLCNLQDLKHLAIRCPSRDDLSMDLTSFVGKLPSGLQSLSLDLSGEPPEDVFHTLHLKFSKEAFPATLTSLKFDMFCVELVDEDGNSMETSYTTSCASIATVAAGNPPGKATVSAPASLKDRVSSELTGAVGSSSSSSQHHNGLAGLLELSAEFYSTSHATTFLRHCPSLQKLELKLRDYANLQMHTVELDDRAVFAPLQLSLCCPRLRSLGLTVTVCNPGDSGESWTAVDELFEIVWAGMTDITGLQSLAIYTAGSLSYDMIVPCLSSLNCLSRLRELSLRCKLDVSDIDCLYEQIQKYEQPQHATTATTLQPETEQTPIKVHGDSTVCESLLSAIQGCTGLRRLVLDAEIVTLEGEEKICIGSSSTVVALQQRLQNCLVLGSDHFEHRSSSTTLYYSY